MNESSEISIDPKNCTGRRFGRFVFRALLGEGAGSLVFLADDLLTERAVARKLPRATADSARHQERFLREARAAARLRHPNFVAVYESGRVEGHLYLALEYINGRALSTLLDASGVPVGDRPNIPAALRQR